jgi:hypothetical protein
MQARCCEAKIVSSSQRLAHHITMPRVNYYAAAHHEAASKFIDQGSSAANYSAVWSEEPPHGAKEALWTSPG